MMARLILLLFMLFALQQSAKAHRLNEYLQATTISVGKDSIHLRLHMTAGSDIANKVLEEIDADGNGFISETEQQLYVRYVLQGLSLSIDDRQATIQFVYWFFPSGDEIRKGTGDIRLDLAAALVPTQATHHLVFENHQRQAFTVYLVNCLLPADTSIGIRGQSRNYDQSIYTLDFTISSTINASSTSRELMDKEDNRAMIKTYFFHGIGHILTGYDHLLFLCALVLGATGLWNLIKIVTAFTIAHSITLTLATLGLAHLPESIVEPFIAASIVFVAVQNIFSPKTAGGEGRLALAFFFGLFHGLGFAGGLLQLMYSIPPHTVAYAILGFSLGVEVGNGLVLLPLYGILQSIKRFQTKTPRIKGLLTLQQLASLVVAVAGFYYLIVVLIKYS